MLADAAYSSYFGKYVSVNQLYQITSLGQIAGDGDVIGASVSPWCLLTLIDYPFVLYWYRLRNKGKKGMLDELAKETEKTISEIIRELIEGELTNDDRCFMLKMCGKKRNLCYL